MPSLTESSAFEIGDEKIRVFYRENNYYSWPFELVSETGVHKVREAYSLSYLIRHCSNTTGVVRYDNEVLGFFDSRQAAENFAKTLSPALIRTVQENNEKYRILFEVVKTYDYGAYDAATKYLAT